MRHRFENLNMLAKHLCTLETGAPGTGCNLTIAQVKDVQAALGVALRALSSEHAIAVCAALIARAGKRSGK